ncbi:hypothetical protein TRAPUB_12775 [Trametes pubescens]|uniref:Uncharacterized protein n=1 Tax=Trametes pubescens TaxID=154538 RepID=A0A1M2VSX4_TRAPU|nr:hypothetical protein TRAPUB_12775 [Trametes pubescens]
MPHLHPLQQCVLCSIIAPILTVRDPKKRSFGKPYIKLTCSLATCRKKNVSSNCANGACRQHCLDAGGCELRGHNVPGFELPPPAPPVLDPAFVHHAGPATDTIDLTM